MFRVSREIDFCYGHRLLDYQGKCRHLHGHNGRVLITIEASGLDKRGMVLDFAEIKRVLHQWIDESLDHRMILHRNDPVVAILKEAGEPICLLDDNPTAENIARLIFDFAAGQGYPVVEVCFWETPRCFATYCREAPVQGTAKKPKRTSPSASIGGQIRAARLAAGLTQTELAERIGWPQSHLSAVERGIRGVGIDVLCRLADALEVECAYEGEGIVFARRGVPGVKRSEPPGP
jgi:6-pyruvoyltetrahydropterin/6-carboxytetrahydropterin synthase